MTKRIVVLMGSVVAVVGLLVFFMNSSSDNSNSSETTNSVPTRLLNSQLAVDYSESAIDLDLVLNGGPGKDGIPALTDPEFVPIDTANVPGDTTTMVVTNNGETKLYPYNIMVWHEIVNDSVGGKPLAVTFCPLCGSAIVFERELNGEVLDFGVSGFLYESNMLMYSRETDESLFSQSLGEAVAGTRTGESLALFPVQLLPFDEAKDLFPDASVLSDDTGFGRNYQRNPYGDYDETEELFFSVSNVDERFPAKELFYIVPFDDKSLAVQVATDDGEYQVEGRGITVTVDRGQITAVRDGEELPGYFEMWFSWATHHQENGIVL